MHKLVTILFSVFLLLFISCDKTSQNGNQQEVPLTYEEDCQASSQYHVGLKQYNDIWCADFEILADLRNRLYIRAESVNGIVVEIFLTDYVNGNYALDGDRNQVIINRFGNVFQSHNGITGNIDIVEYSPANQIVGANFNFNAINYGSGEQQFIQGSFRIQYF